jgi:glycosyltransferase involved in cell wall biosynthesis
VICFFNTTEAWGGGEKWHFEIAAHLHADGVPVMVVTNKKSGLFEKVVSAGIPCHQFKIGNLSFLNPAKILQLKSFFRKHGIKTLVMNLPSDLKSAGIAARLAGVDRIIYRRGSAIPVKNTLLNRYLFGHVITEVLANSHETRRTLLANNRQLIDENKIKVIYNGIRIENYLPQPTHKPSGKIIIGNLGRLEKQKAQHLLIHLAENLRKEHFDFVIKIGGDGRLRDDLEKQIKAKHLEGVVQLAGHIHDVPAFLNELHIFVLPSLWEGFGYVLAEAMAMQKPVAAFHISSNAELVEDGVTGYLAKPGDMNDLTQKIIRLIRDENLRTDMGINGRKRVKEKFDFGKMYGEVKQFLLGIK